METRLLKERFKAKEGAFAVLMSDPPTLAQVKEISKGGLTVCYFGRQIPVKTSKLDIFLSTNDFSLCGVPFKTASSVEVTIEFPGSFLKMRQKDLMFGELTPHQKAQLDYLLRNHTLNGL